MNLAVNARDAMPQGGQLTIETATVELGAQFVMLAVSDSGAGMSPEVQARVFEPFFTTKELGQGTGLGLATCYGIVKQHGGSISVDSAVGQGTTIRIELPAQPGVYPTQAALLAAVELPQGHETVLLVEDQADVRQFAARVLRGLGYIVVEAANSTEAIERALEKPHPAPGDRCGNARAERERAGGATNGARPRLEDYLHVGLYRGSSGAGWLGGSRRRLPE